MNWSTVFDAFIGAFLAFIFAGILQYWLLVRQEKFQERMEAKRAEEDEKADQRRLETEKKIAHLHAETMKKIAMDNRNFETAERSKDRSAMRKLT